MNIPSGWVDLQVNGHIGIDFSSPGLTSDTFLKAIEGILSSGTGIFLPTIITSPFELYHRNLSLMKKAIVSAGLEAHIPGIHLEGPFLSTEAIGAHNSAWLQPCQKEKLKELLDIVPGFVRLITIAADQGGSQEIIRYARKNNVIVSIGHHMATNADISAAAQAGASVLTHFGNGLPNLIDRHYNPIWPALAEDTLIAMIIADGHHLPLEVVKCFLKVKGVSNTIVVSDAAPVAGLPPGKYNTLGNDVVLESNGRLHNPVKQCLTGSSYTLSMCMTWLASTGLVEDDNDLLRLGRINPLKLIESASPCCS